MLYRQVIAAQTSLIMHISGFIAIGILPFAVIRFINGDYPVAILNTTAVVVTSILFIYVWLTQKTELARWGLALLSVSVMTVTVYLKGNEQIIWTYPALTTVFFLLPAISAVIISSVFIFAVLFLLSPGIDVLLALKYGVSAAATMLFCYAFASRMNKQQTYLAQLATTDPLTLIGNRRALEEKLMTTTRLIQQSDLQSACIIIIDVDHFKNINDTYGHSTGDMVLCSFAHVVEGSLAHRESLYRLGGEEFVVLIENASLKDAGSAAERLRQIVEKHDFTIDNQVLTFSAGIAKYHPNESVLEWIDRADKSMYQAKQQGRNCWLTEETSN